MQVMYINFANFVQLMGFSIAPAWHNSNRIKQLCFGMKRALVRFGFESNEANDNENSSGFAGG
jgi:hypothetical protein